MENAVHGVQLDKSFGRNFPAFINNCQLGLTSSYRFRDDFLKLRLRELSPATMYEVNFDFHGFDRNPGPPYECTFVSPYAESFACSWVSGDFPEQLLIVGIFHKKPAVENICSEPSNLGYPVISQQVELMEVHRNSDLIDICHIDKINNYVDSFLTISQHVYTTCSRFQMSPMNRCVNLPHNEYQKAIRMQHKAWNAAWNSDIQKLSLGTNKGISFTTLNALFGEVGDVICPGRNPERFLLPYVQRFNCCGNSLYLGFHDGHVACLDTRTTLTSFQSEIVVGNAVTDLQLLQDGTTMIVDCLNDKLCCVDTRMNSVVFDYAGHCTEGKKTAFYVDESLEILCSSGRDYVTRYWSLKHGSLLAEITEDFPEKRGLFMYTSFGLEGRKVFSYTFSGDKMCYREAFSDNVQ